MRKEIITEIMKENKQFPDKPDDSILWKSIAQATGVSDAEAQKAAVFHCNSLSSYALYRAHEWIMFPYSIWVEKLVAADYFDAMTGWVKASQLKIAELFGFADKYNRIDYIYNYEQLMSGKGIDKSKGVKIKVYSNSNKSNIPGKGDHFMAGYYIGDELYLDDSGNRGYGVRARDVIPKNKFQWGSII